MLRYICSRALVEDAEPITEYTIAIDVLGKSQDFKESKDANVRVEVHRLRKRLAQFYEQEGASHRLRIVIPTGRYVPQFLLQDAPSAGETDAAYQAEFSSTSVPPAQLNAAPASASIAPLEDQAAGGVLSPSRQAGWGRSLNISKIALFGVVLAAFGIAFQIFGRVPDPLDSFWRPVFSSQNQILLCVGNLRGARRSALESEAGALSMRDFHGLDSQTVHLVDATTLSRFAGLLQAKGKPYRIASQSEATFADLQNGPAILIGLLNNEWTERLVGKLRFTVERPAPGKVIIRDRNHPSQNDWSMDYSTPYLNITKDYALVLRVLDPKTGQLVVTAAGISVFGTLAAGEFLTSPNEIRKLEAVAPRDWTHKNVEIVLSTDVIRGKSGRPSVIATYFW